jgi:hypothetical protein
MSAQHRGRVTLFLAPPTVDETEHLGVPFDVSEEAMRRLRDPFRAGSAGPERARGSDGDAAATAPAGL